MRIDETLERREQIYGDFDSLSCLSQLIKDTCRNTPNWPKLSEGQKEALDMIAVKMARILSGDPNYLYNWHDIEGYARLGLASCKLEKSE